MSRPRSTDPLVPLPCRVPASVVAYLDGFVQANGVTMSDAFRAHMNIEQVKPLGKAVPRKRDLSSRHVSKADPDLLRNLAAIGNNCNQMARAMNETALSNQQIDLVKALDELRKIQDQLRALAMKGAA